MYKYIYNTFHMHITQIHKYVYKCIYMHIYITHSLWNKQGIFIMIIVLISVIGAMIIAGVYSYHLSYPSCVPVAFSKCLSWLWSFTWCNHPNLHSLTVVDLSGQEYYSFTMTLIAGHGKVLKDPPRNLYSRHNLPYFCCGVVIQFSLILRVIYPSQHHNSHVTFWFRDVKNGWMVVFTSNSVESFLFLLVEALFPLETWTLDQWRIRSLG